MGIFGVYGVYLAIWAPSAPLKIFREKFSEISLLRRNARPNSPRETTKCSLRQHSGTIMDRKRPHCSATSAGDQEAIKLMPPPPPPALPVLETEWERKKRVSDARRAENAFMEEALRRERAELERVACERTSAGHGPVRAIGAARVPGGASARRQAHRGRDRQATGRHTSARLRSKRDSTPKRRPTLSH